MSPKSKPHNELHEDMDIGSPEQIREVVEKSFGKGATRAVVVTLRNGEILPKEFEKLVPIAVQVDPLIGEFISLWFMVNDLKRIN